MYILHHTRLQICTLIKLILDFLVNYDMWRNSVTKASHATSGGCMRTHGGVIAKSGLVALWLCGLAVMSVSWVIAKGSLVALC